MARFVLRHCRDKAEEVLRNAKYPLTVAYEEAQAIVEAQRLAEEERQRQLAALADFKEDYPDLIALVDDKRLSILDAVAAGQQRREAARLKAERIAFEAAEQENRTVEPRQTPLDQLRRLAVALDSGHWPDDLAEWLGAGIDRALQGESLDRALGLIPPWGKPSYRRQEVLAARDASIRQLADSVGGDLSALQRELAAQGIPRFSPRHINRILNRSR